MYLNGNDFKAGMATKAARKDNVRIDAERRNMAAAANAVMVEWVKTLTPQQRKQLGIR